MNTKDQMFSFNKAVIFMIAAFFLFNIASAATLEEITQPVKVNNCINLPKQEFNSTWQNVTFIMRPDGTMQSIQKSMTKNGYGYNYSYCDTTLSGTYTANGCSDISCWSYEFNVTTTGVDNIYIFLIIFITVIIGIFILGYTLENAWIMTLFSILVLLFGFFIIIYGIDMFKDTTTTWAIGLIVWAIGIYALFLSVQEQLKEWR